MSLLSEILEQPSCLQRQLETQKRTTGEIAQAIHSAKIRYVYLAGRGTSDNAARYAVYLWGTANGLPVALAAPSLFTYYNKPPDLRSALVVGISQSGRSPDIVSVLTEGKRQGCLTLAITNDVESPLAKAADFVLNIEAGKENAVAATKTYTCELMAIAMLSAAIIGAESRWKDLAAVPDRVQQALDHQNGMDEKVQRYASIASCAVLGRGFNYANASEWALKLKELTYIHAESYSSADFMHGPIALVNEGFPILAIATKGEVFAAMVEVLRDLRQERGAELVVISGAREALTLAHTPLALRQVLPEWLSPFITILPAQLFCYHLALARGCDTESPRGIHKVTETM